MYHIYTKFWQKNWLEAAQDWAIITNCTVVDVERRGTFNKVLRFSVVGHEDDIPQFDFIFQHWMSASGTRFTWGMVRTV